MYAAVICAIRKVKKASVTNTAALSPIFLLIISLVFSKILVMKRNALVLFIALIISLGLLACKSAKTAATNADKENDTTTATVQSQPSPAASPAVESIEGILGSYVGSFGDNKITLLITKCGGGLVSGRSIVGGNDRPFDGTLSVEGGDYSIVAREPGDNKYDGVFRFRISQANLNEVKGTWKPNDTKRPEKSYTLERKKFEYRAGLGSWPQPSQRLLKAGDVENLPKRHQRQHRPGQQ